MKLVLLTATEVLEKQKQGALLIDLSDACDYRREHIKGSISQPIDVLQAKGLPEQAKQASEIIYYCRVGVRTSMADPFLAELLPDKQAYMLENGLRGWRDAYLPTELNRSAPMELMRQVQIGAGSMVLLGALLGWLLSPYFFLICAFVGGGLICSGITGWCGMTVLLAKMPWNRLD